MTKINKNLISDEDLLKKIKNGDENAENEILARYKDLVVKISRCYFIVGDDIEDIIQEGMIGLYKAIKNYDSSKEAKFKTFAVLCIKHQIQNAIKLSNTNKNKPLSDAISLQDLSPAENEDDFVSAPIELLFEYDPIEKAIDKEEFLNLNNQIKSILSKFEFEVLKFYLQGYTYKEISKSLNVSPKSIDNSLSRIKNKLKAKLVK